MSKIVERKHLNKCEHVRQTASLCVRPLDHWFLGRFGVFFRSGLTLRSEETASSELSGFRVSVVVLRFWFIFEFFCNNSFTLTYPTVAFPVLGVTGFSHRPRFFVNNCE